MSETDDKAAALARTSLFEGLPPESLQRLAAIAKARDYAADTVVFRKGDLSRSLYVIDQGRVRISTSAASGKDIVLNLLGPGQVFGEIALVDGSERTADAVAVERARLLSLDRAELTDFLEREPGMMRRMLVALTQRLRWVSGRMEDQTFLTLPARLAKRLLFLGEHFGVDGPTGRRLTVSLPQRELASHMNVSRETVNRLIQDWLDRGLIEMRRGFVVLGDPAALEEIVGRG